MFVFKKVSLFLFIAFADFLTAKPLHAKIFDIHNEVSFLISQSKETGNKQVSSDENDNEHDVVVSDMHFPARHLRRRRAVTAVDRWKWKNATVPYVFDTILPVSDSARNLTLKSFAHIEEFTCVRFVARTDEPDYVNITKLIGCWSNVGSAGGMQKLSLGTNCEHFGVILHEIMHALGFFHEHNRPDRDDFIVVNFTNVKPQFHKEFTKINLTDPKYGDKTLQNLSYDLSSVMHYGRYTFSKHADASGLVWAGQVNMTMYAIGDSDFFLGSKDQHLSYMDKVRINKFFTCNITVDRPEAKAPTTQPITTQAPSTQTPSTKAPSTQTPSTKAPSTKISSTKTPSTTLIVVSTKNPDTTIKSTNRPLTTTNTSDNGSNWGLPNPDGANQHSGSIITIVFAFFATFMLFNQVICV